MSNPPPVPGSFVRVQNFFMALVAIVCVLLIVDTLHWHYGSSIRKIHYLIEADYLVLAISFGYLACCVFARGFARKLGLSFTAIGVTMLAIEGAITLMSMYSDRPWPWYVWPPNYRCILSTADLSGVSMEGVMTTNSRGVRGPEFSDSDRFRILCIGGSTTECVYLDDKKTWPYLLGEGLSETHEGTWVGNVGRSSTTAVDHVTLVEQLPEAQMVDMWVVLCGLNDMSFQMQGRGGYAMKAEDTFTRTFSYRRPGFGGPLVRPFHRNFYIYKLLDNLNKRIRIAISGGDFIVYQDRKARWINRVQAMRQAGKKTSEMPDMEPMLDEYEHQLMCLIDVARRSNKLLVLLTQPTLWSEGMDEEAESRTVGGRDPNNNYYTNDVRARTMAMYNQRMMEVAAREKVPCVDMATLLPHSIDVFYDDVHFNELGAELVARHLVVRIEPIITAHQKDNAPAASHTTNP